MSDLNDDDPIDDQTNNEEVIVIDIGTGSVKAGWAGEDAPRVVIPTIVLDDSDGGESKDFLIGQDALQTLHSDDKHAISLPVERGEITDWVAMEKIWDHIFRELKVESNQFSVMVTNPPGASMNMRTQIARRMFGTFRVPALTICNQAVLSLYASGRTTGIVLEAGEGLTNAVPVFEGYALPHAMMQLNMAGRDLTRNLMQILSERGIVFSESHVDIVRDIKEKLCAVAVSREDLQAIDNELNGEVTDQRVNNNNNNSNMDELTYELPDGQVIRIDTHCRYHTPEILFNPTGWPDLQGPRPLTQECSLGVHEMIYQSIMQCDSYLRKGLFSNVILAGGTSMFNGYGERMQRELDGLTGGHQFIDIVTDSQRKYAAWIGGSMYASLSTFNQIKVSRHEYQEDPNQVHKKYF
jgi:actin-related protein